MTEFQPRLDILPEEQKAIWPLLTPVTQMGFTLYGGTAIALQLGHRQSVDFDFFTHQSFDTHHIEESLVFLKGAEVHQDSKNTYSVRTTGGVLLSFFGGISFGRVDIPLITSDTKIQVASLNDLMATKLKVLFNRIEYKDYRDISEMVQHGVDVAKGLAAAKAMYGNNFQPGEALKAMTYFEGGDLEKLTLHDRNVLIKAAYDIETLPEVSILSKSLSVENFEDSEKKKNTHRYRMR